VKPVGPRRAGCDLPDPDLELPALADPHKPLPQFGMSADWLFGISFVGVELVTGIGGTITWILLTRSSSRSATVTANTPWLLQTGARRRDHLDLSTIIAIGDRYRQKCASGCDV